MHHPCSWHQRPYLILCPCLSSTQGLVSSEGAEIDDDLTGSALEDMAVGGADGLEADALLQLAKSIAVAILELIGIGL